MKRNLSCNLKKVLCIVQYYHIFNLTCHYQESIFLSEHKKCLDLLFIVLFLWPLLSWCPFPISPSKKVVQYPINLQVTFFPIFNWKFAPSTQLGDFNIEFAKKEPPKSWQFTAVFSKRKVIMKQSNNSSVDTFCFIFYLFCNCCLMGSQIMFLIGYCDQIYPEWQAQNHYLCLM